MVSPRSSTVPQAGAGKRILTGLLTGTVALAVAALGVVHFGSDLGALWAAGDEPAPVVAGPALPVDGPAVAMARVRHQETGNSQALHQLAAPGGVLQLDDWSFTQVSGSPFLFDPPGSFDFFNPLFAFNSGGLTRQQLFGIAFAEIMALPNSGATVVPVYVGPSGSTTMVLSPAGTGPANGTTTTTLPNGTVVTATTTTTKTMLPMQMGLAGFSHRHVIAPGTSVTTIRTLSTSPTTPNQ